MNKYSLSALLAVKPELINQLWLHLVHLLSRVDYMNILRRFESDFIIQWKCQKLEEFYKLRKLIYLADLIRLNIKKI